MTSILKKMGKRDFLAKFGCIYENSPWVPRRVWANGLNSGCDTIDGLHASMIKVVDAAKIELKLSLLRNHPQLATKCSPKTKLTKQSETEQINAGLSNCTKAELDKFTSLNIRYKEKFGFPFILAVKGKKVPEILSIFQNRIQNDSTEELYECIAQVHQIAKFRLKDTFESLGL